MNETDSWIHIATIGRPHSLKGRAFLSIEIFNLDIASFDKSTLVRIGNQADYSIPGKIKIKNPHKNIFEFNIFDSPDDVEKFINQKIWITKNQLQRRHVDMPFCFEIENCELHSPKGELLCKIDYLDHQLLQPNLIFGQKRMPFTIDLFESLIPEKNRVTLNTLGFNLYCEL